MAIKGRSANQTTINTRLADNVTNLIEPVDTRTTQTDLNDSSFNITDDDTDRINEGLKLFTNAVDKAKVANVPTDTNAAISTLQSQINNLSGSLVPQGNWDAATNTPDITAEVGEGRYWVVNVAGATDLGGLTDWSINDWAVRTATGWLKIDNSDAVLSVNTKKGVVVLNTDDIAPTVSRAYLTDLPQTISNTKTFDSLATFEQGIRAHRPSVNEGGSFTVAATHKNKQVQLITAGAVVITIDDSTVAAFEKDDEVEFAWLIDLGANTVEFAVGGSQAIVSEDSALGLSKVGSGAFLKYIENNVWLLIGSLI